MMRFSSLLVASLVFAALPACDANVTQYNHDPDASVNPDDPDASVNPDTPDANPDEPDAIVDDSCGDWRIGTLTGYNNSSTIDDPNAGNVMEFGGLNDTFYANVNLAAIDLSDWPSGQYHYVDVRFNGHVGRVAVWDACLNSDCPDGTDCCTQNRNRYANPGYLVDVETRTAKRLWNVDMAEDTLQDEIELRICGTFDPDAIAAMYGAHRNP